MPIQTLAKTLLTGALIIGGIIAPAQYNAPGTPAPYNPIALAEVTATPRKVVQAKQSTIQGRSQIPYLGGVPAGTSVRRRCP